MIKRVLLIIIAIVVLGITAEGQRRVTPVNPTSPTAPVKKKKEVKTDEVDLSTYVEMKDSEGRVFLMDTITGKEYVDSAAIKAKEIMKYPAMHALTFGVDVWDPVMRLIGQDYGGVEAWAELSLYNRFKPVVEVGVGAAEYAPEDGNYTYKSPLSPYFRIGMNYNFLYGKTDAYQIQAGVRYGLSPFSYSVNNVSADAGYWNEPLVFDIPTQKTVVGYLGASLNIKVKIVSNLYMGWAVKYNYILHESKAPYGKPWYIPGYGTRGLAIGGGFSIMYTIPLSKKTVDIATEEPQDPEQ